MTFYHSNIGNCKFIIQFEGKCNQLVLVKAHKTHSPKGSIDIRLGTKPKYWLLWGNLDMKIEDLGTTCLTYVNGNSYTESKAIKTFIEASKYVDELTINKIVKNESL